MTRMRLYEAWPVELEPDYVFCPPALKWALAMVQSGTVIGLELCEEGLLVTLEPADPAQAEGREAQDAEIA